MHIRFSLLNVQGLVTKTTNKLFSDELRLIFRQSDFVLLTETWASEFTDLSVDDFILIQLNRLEQRHKAKRCSGGIALYIRQSLYRYCTVLAKNSDDIVWMKIQGNLFNLSHDLFLCLCYIIPVTSSREGLVEMDVLDRISNYILKISNDTDGCYNLLVCGDFNSRTGNEGDYVFFDNDTNIDILPPDYQIDAAITRCSEDKKINTNGRKLLAFCKENSLRIANGRIGSDKGIGKYTFVGSSGSSVIDYVLVNPSLLPIISTFHVSEPNILSDHCLIDFSLRCNVRNETVDARQNLTFEKVSKKYIWNESKNIEYFSNLEKEDKSFTNLNAQLAQALNIEQIEENLNTFTLLMENVCDPLFAKTVHSTCMDDNSNFDQTPKQPWFDEECRNFRKSFYESLNHYRAEKSSENKNRLVNTRKQYKTILRNKRYTYTKEKTQKLLVSKCKNVKQYWKLLKQSANLNKKCSIDAKRFSEYFQAISDPNDRFYQADEDILYFNERYMQGELQVMFEELNLLISVEEIMKGVGQLRNGASAGPDLFLNEFLKNGTTGLITYLHNLFNKVFEMGYFPERWAEGHIIPIFKKGDKNEASNYRGITLLSTIGKLFTRILNNRLNDWSEEYNIYVEAQAGFRKGMGTSDNIFVLNNLITHCLSNNDMLYCAFIDFTKAFDFVVRDVLWFKLIRLGVRGRMLNIIKSIYSCVKPRVKHDNTLSDPFTCNIGVRQGECLSPFLFAMYVNDLEAELTVKGVAGIDIGTINLNILLYADDIILFGKNPDDLQNALNALEDYCKKWKLTVNTSKTKIMVFRNGGCLPNDLNFVYNNINIEIVSKFCYLGIVFTPGGSNFEAQKTLAGQAHKAVFTLNKYLYNFSELTPSHKLELFDKLVSPILNFGSEVWGFYKSSSIETVHLQFWKRIIGVKQSTQNDFIYGDLGRTDYQSRRYIIIIKYWLKIISSDDRKYIKQVYNTMLNDITLQPLKQNWASCVKNLLSRLGFLHVWESQGVGNENAFLKIFKQRITDNFTQNWHSRLGNSTRARSYLTFANFQYQKYLDILSIVKYRKSLSRLRLSSHRLEVEVGRWT